jgi:hypothetical protein
MRSRLLLIGLVAGVCLSDSVTRAADCSAVGNVKFICGIVSPEDLVAVPGTAWVVASGYVGGAVHLINALDDTSVQVFPTAMPRLRPDRRAYPSCPGPLDPNEKEKFSAHGLNVRLGRNGVHTMYVVHHGFRESIEVFEIDAKPRTPALTWVGCILTPDTAIFNAVAPLPDGGLVATNPYRRGDPDANKRSLAGLDTGEVMEWHQGDGWKIIPGSEGPGPNGLEVSKDGEWLYVNLFPTARVIRLSRRQTPIRKDVVELSFHPDNIRWQADGSLLTTGTYAPTLARLSECVRVKCTDASAKVARIDPQTLKVQEIIDFRSDDNFFGATVALRVSKEIWIGSFRGDRIARYPMP